MDPDILLTLKTLKELEIVCIAAACTCFIAFIWAMWGKHVERLIVKCYTLMRRVLQLGPEGKVARSIKRVLLYSEDLFSSNRDLTKREKCVFTVVITVLSCFFIFLASWQVTVDMRNYNRDRKAYQESLKAQAEKEAEQLRMLFELEVKTREYILEQYQKLFVPQGKENNGSSLEGDFLVNPFHEN